MQSTKTVGAPNTEHAEDAPGPTGRNRWRGRLPRGRFLLYVGLFVLLVLIIVPIVQLVLMSFRTGSLIAPGPLTLDNYRVAAEAGATGKVLKNTLVFALLSTAIALVLAATFAWLTERTDMPFRNLAWTLIILPMAVPPVLFAMAWTFLLSPRTGYVNVVLRDLLPFLPDDRGPINVNTMAGMVFVMSLTMVPTIFLMLVGSFRMMDPSLEEAGRVGGLRQWRVVRGVSLALMFPAFLVAAMYSFMGVLENFDIALVLGIPGNIHVLSTLIYFTAQLRVPSDYGVAAVYSVLFMCIGLLLVLIYRRLVRLDNRFATVRGKAFKPRRLPLGKWRYPALALLAVYFMCALVLPLGMLVWRAIMPVYLEPSFEALGKASMANFRAVLRDDLFNLAVFNSVIVMLAVATLAMVLATVASWFVVRRGGIIGGGVDGLVFMTIGIPGVVTALAMIFIFVASPARAVPVYGTVLVLILPLTVSFVAFGSRVTNTAMRQIHPELEEAGKVAGVSEAVLLRRVTLPLILPAFLSGFIWVAVHVMRTVTTPLILYTNDNVVLSVLLWLHWDNGDPGKAAALGVMLTGVLLILTAVARRLMSRVFSDS